VISAAVEPSSKWPWLLVVAIIGMYLILAILIEPGADTLWRLHIAQGVLDGKVLYRDLIEVNPPLWFWGALPAAALGGYPALVAINLVATLTGLASFAALVRLTHSNSGLRGGVVGLAAGLCLVNVAEIGQREQAFLLACALWSALAAARIEGKAVPLWLALSATVFAAYGFALKHYFVVVPIAIECLVMWHKRRAWNPFRIETLLLAALALAYGIAVIWLTPDFLGRILGLVDLSYYGFGPSNTNSLAQHQLSLVLKCALVCIPLMGMILVREKQALVQALVLALCLSVLIVMLQQKGWRYHFIATNGLSLIIMALLWEGSRTDTTMKVGRLFFPVGIGALAISAIVQPSLSNLKTNGQPMDGVLAALAVTEPRQHHIAILSTAPDNAYFPLARAKRAHWTRHYSMWMLPGLWEARKDPKREALRLSERARILAEFTADLTCTPPDIIVGEVGYFRNLAPNRFDSMEFLAQDPAFAAWIAAHYRRAPDVGRYPVWRLAGVKPSPQNCARVQ
jgi:hypothetical protein